MTSQNVALLDINIALWVTFLFIVTKTFHLWKMTYLTFNWHNSVKSWNFLCGFRQNDSLWQLYQYKTLSFDLKKNVFEVLSYTFFHDLIHVYSPGAGADSPQGTKFWCQQKGLITLPICCKFQRNLFEVWFYTMFFSWLNTCTCI